MNVRSVCRFERISKGFEHAHVLKNILFRSKKSQNLKHDLQLPTIYWHFEQLVLYHFQSPDHFHFRLIFKPFFFQDRKPRLRHFGLKRVPRSIAIYQHTRQWPGKKTYMFTVWPASSGYQVPTSRTSQLISQVATSHIMLLYLGRHYERDALQDISFFLTLGQYS